MIWIETEKQIKQKQRKLKYFCHICNKGHQTSEDLVEHMKRNHIGMLSKESFEYLLELGINKEKIVKFCEENKIKLPEEVMN